MKIHKYRIDKYTHKYEIDVWVSLWVKKLPDILCIEKPGNKHGKPATNKVFDIRIENLETDTRYFWLA